VGHGVLATQRGRRDDRGVERLVLVLVLVAVAIGVAVVVERRRRPDAPTNVGHTVPDQLDRRDFARPEAPWLVAVFTSATCSTCAGVCDKARLLASDDVAVQEVEVGAARDLHERYRITAVPALVVADREGAVRASFLGPVTATDLWATVAELREPGTLPTGGCDHGMGAGDATAPTEHA
jgi:thioredoxin-related protein